MTPVNPMKSPTNSHKKFDFNFNTTKLTSSSLSSMKKNDNGSLGGTLSASVYLQRTRGWWNPHSHRQLPIAENGGTLILTVTFFEQHFRTSLQCGRLRFLLCQNT
ncbi:hypothetical protein ACH5RR_006245 [Cinchona calisaya]|uniref:Uncharacterized protein n=1 Tax=Cinchona calisaya TaxID=153742 RepID=A0ABD3ANH7_9GENT